MVNNLLLCFRWVNIIGASSEEGVVLVGAAYKFPEGFFIGSELVGCEIDHGFQIFFL